MAGLADELMRAIEIPQYGRQVGTVPNVPLYGKTKLGGARLPPSPMIQGGLPGGGPLSSKMTTLMANPQATGMAEANPPWANPADPHGMTGPGPGQQTFTRGPLRGGMPTVSASGTFAKGSPLAAPSATTPYQAQTGGAASAPRPFMPPNEFGVPAGGHMPGVGDPFSPGFGQAVPAPGASAAPPPQVPPNLPGGPSAWEENLRNTLRGGGREGGGAGAAAGAAEGEMGAVGRAAGWGLNKLASIPGVRPLGGAIAKNAITGPMARGLGRGLPYLSTAMGGVPNFLASGVTGPEALMGGGYPEKAGWHDLSAGIQQGVERTQGPLMAGLYGMVPGNIHRAGETLYHQAKQLGGAALGYNPLQLPELTPEQERHVAGRSWNRERMAAPDPNAAAEGQAARAQAEATLNQLMSGAARPEAGPVRSGTAGPNDFAGGSIGRTLGGAIGGPAGSALGGAIGGMFGGPSGGGVPQNQNTQNGQVPPRATPSAGPNGHPPAAPRSADVPSATGQGAAGGVPGRPGAAPGTAPPTDPLEAMLMQRLATVQNPVNYRGGGPSTSFSMAGPLDPSGLGGTGLGQALGFNQTMVPQQPVFPGTPGIGEAMSNDFASTMGGMLGLRQGQQHLAGAQMQGAVGMETAKAHQMQAQAAMAEAQNRSISGRMQDPAARALMAREAGMNPQDLEDIYRFPNMGSWPGFSDMLQKSRAGTATPDDWMRYHAMAKQIQPENYEMDEAVRSKMMAYGPEALKAAREPGWFGMGTQSAREQAAFQDQLFARRRQPGARQQVQATR